MSHVKEVFSHLPVSNKLVLILWLFVAMVISLLALNYEVIQSLSAVRAYVGGEGLWSKAQKQAVLDLMRYANSREEQDYQSYQRALETPLGDRKARLELQTETPDLNVVFTGFVQGRNDPADVKGLATLFRRFRRTTYIAEAVRIWAEGDLYIEQLQRLGEQLHREIRSGRSSAARVAEITRQVEAVGDKLAPLEDRFSYSLGKGARWTAGLFLLVMYGASSASLTLGIAFTILLLRHVRQAEEKYKHLIDTANDAILVLDAHTGLILEANERTSVLLGLPAGWIVGKRGEDICPEMDKGAFRQTLLRTLEGAKFTGKEINVLHSDGHVIPVEVNTSITQLEGKKIIQGIFRDITERKRSEEDLRQAQKLEVVGQLAGGIAHDFNNLLMIIRTHTSKIKDLASEARVHKYVETIQIAADRAVSLTNQLLAFGRKQVLRVEVVDLNELLEEMKPLLAAVPPATVRLVVIPSAEPVSVRVDPGQIEQVIMNLAVNARDAMPRGGVLKIQTTRVWRNTAHTRDDRSDPHALVEVTDTGCGLDAETKAHIFEPFFTTKSGKGIGLGLSTVYGIVKQSGGSIEVDSILDVGTTFRVRLPLVEQPTRHRMSHSPVRALLGGSETILVAEDQSEIRTVLCEFLESNGYKVLEAENGTEALALAERYRGRVDVLVTDVTMPQIKGFDLARQISRLDRRVKVIFMSGYPEEALVEGGLISDAYTALIQKPFDPEGLALKIRESLSVREHDA